MQVYFFTAGIESNELSELESRIRSRLPGLRKVASIEEVTSRLGQEGATADRDQHYIILPMLRVTSFDVKAAVSGVHTSPGATPLTRIPREA